MNSPTLLFAGGGSLGHVLPSVAVADAVRNTRPDSRTVFVCANRPDETACLKEAHYRYRTLHAQSFPYLFSLSLFTFPFLFFVACLHARNILLQEKPDVVFSKGGSVSVPVCLMASWLRIPVVLHESDSVASGSTRLIARFATTICTGFPSLDLPSRLNVRSRHTGSPVRPDLLRGSKAAGQRITGFSGKRPVLMIIGGSQGSVALNEAVRSGFEALLAQADIIHLTGAGKMMPLTHARYFVRPTVGEELPHLYALADIMISRGGIGVLSELAALRKAVIVVPLTGVGHDHQLRNAEFLEKSGAIVLLPQENLSTLTEAVESLLHDDLRRNNLSESLHHVFPDRAAETIAEILLANVKGAQIQS